MDKLPMSKGVLVAATIAVYALFLILVGYGWWELIVREGSPPLARALQIVIVGLIVVLGSIAVRSIAILRAQPSTEGSKASRFRGLGYWLVAALITVVGTVIGAFNWLESRAILRDDVALVQNRFNELSVEAGNKLGSNRYTAEKKQLESYLLALKNEIDEPTGLTCGFAKDAAIQLANINTIVKVERTSASRPIEPCDRALTQRMYAPYESQTWAAFDAKWQGGNAAERDKQSLLTKIAEDHGAHRDALVSLAQSSEGFGSTAFIDKRPLIDAQSKFNEDLQAFRVFEPAVAEAIGSVDHLQSSDTESYAATFQLLYERRYNVRTWIYVLLAIMIDFVLIGLLTQMAKRYRKQRGGRLGLSSAERQLLLKFQSDPRFLWTPAWAAPKDRI